MPVSEMLRDKIPITVALTVLSFLMILVISVPVSIWTALHAGKWADSLVMAVNQILMSVPDFFLEFSLSMYADCC